MQINRLKQLRELLNISQSEFAKKTGLDRSSISLFESGKREIQDRHIKLICQTFNVNEEWLRNGTEPIFKEKDTELIKEIVEKYDLDKTDELILRNFLNLNKEERSEVISIAKKLVELLTKPKVEKTDNRTVTLKNGEKAIIGTTFEDDLLSLRQSNNELKTKKFNI